MNFCFKTKVNLLGLVIVSFKHEITLIYSKQVLYFIVTLFILSSNIQLFGQDNSCEKLYTWEFNTSDGERNSITRMLTNEVEEILTEINSCEILQRRTLDEITNQVENEIQITSTEDFGDLLDRKFETTPAQFVLFGTIKEGLSSNILLRLRIERLSNKQLVKAKSIVIKNDTLINRTLRWSVLKREIYRMLSIHFVPSVQRKGWPFRYKVNSLYKPESRQLNTSFFIAGGVLVTWGSSIILSNRSQAKLDKGKINGSETCHNIANSLNKIAFVGKFTIPILPIVAVISMNKKKRKQRNMP